MNTLLIGLKSEKPKSPYFLKNFHSYLLPVLLHRGFAHVSSVVVGVLHGSVSLVTVLSVPLIS